MTLYKCQHPFSHMKLPVHMSTTHDSAPEAISGCMLASTNCSHWVTPNLPLQAPAPSILPGSTIK